MSKVETPCEWCQDEDGMFFCPFSDNPTSDMCANCQAEREDADASERSYE